MPGKDTALSTLCWNADEQNKLGLRRKDRGHEEEARLCCVRPLGLICYNVVQFRPC